MSWQTDTINPAVTSPAVDISKITNDLQVLRDTFAGNEDPDVPVVLDPEKLDGLIPNANLASSGTPSANTFLAGDRTWKSSEFNIAALNTETPATDDFLPFSDTSNSGLNRKATVQSVVALGLNATGSAPTYACRAWVNFNGTTTPPTIRASGNVSSVAKNSTGNYTVNFTTAMPDADYAMNATIIAQSSDNYVRVTEGLSRSASSCSVFSRVAGSSFTDTAQISVSVFR